MSKISVTIEGRTYEVEVDIPSQCDGTQLTALVDGMPVQVVASALDSPDRMEWVLVDDRPHEIVIDRDLGWIRSHSGRYRLEVRDLEAPSIRSIGGDSRVKAPIPGLISRVLVSRGDRVEAGQPILMLEAMKMENEIRAPRSGVVSRLDVSVGQRVALYEVLAEVT